MKEGRSRLTKQIMRLKKKSGYTDERLDFVFLFLFFRSETVWFGRLETLCRPPAWKNSGIQYDSSSHIQAFSCFVFLSFYHFFGIFRTLMRIILCRTVHAVTIPKRSTYADGWRSKPSTQYSYELVGMECLVTAAPANTV